MSISLLTLLNVNSQLVYLYYLPFLQTYSQTDILSNNKGEPDFLIHDVSCFYHVKSIMK